jgi:hypothetical protein
MDSLTRARAICSAANRGSTDSCRERSITRRVFSRIVCAIRSNACARPSPYWRSRDDAAGVDDPVGQAEHAPVVQDRFRALVTRMFALLNTSIA